MKIHLKNGFGLVISLLVAIVVAVILIKSSSLFKGIALKQTIYLLLSTAQGQMS